MTEIPSARSDARAIPPVRHSPDTTPGCGGSSPRIAAAAFFVALMIPLAGCADVREEKSDLKVGHAKVVRVVNTPSSRWIQLIPMPEGGLIPIIRTRPAIKEIVVEFEGYEIHVDHDHPTSFAVGDMVAFRYCDVFEVTYENEAEISRKHSRYAVANAWKETEE